MMKVSIMKCDLKTTTSEIDIMVVYTSPYERYYKAIVKMGVKNNVFRILRYICLSCIFEREIISLEIHYR